MTILEQLKEAVERGDTKACVALAQQVVADGLDPMEAIDGGLAIGMKIIGDNFQSGQAFLPEMMLAASAMNAAVDILEPAIAAKGLNVEKKGKIMLATIHGDMHDIGKNIVKLMFSTSGFEVTDLGKDVRVATIIEQAEAHQADIIAVSALMTTTMGYMRVLMEELEFAGIRDKYKVMIGGAPVTQEWAEKIGVDGYAKDAVGAVKKAGELMGK
jgi:corrinoid protein of di/trimethylamine methyltransferase